MKTRHWTACLLGLTLGLLLLTAPWATRSQAAGNATLVEFRSRTCPYCYQLSGILEDLQSKYAGQISVMYYTIETDDPMFKQYRVSLVPTLVILGPSGSEVYRHEGMLSKDAVVSALKGLNLIRD
jgi:thiol-disulfide isomerase/thioredoxin